MKTILLKRFLSLSLRTHLLLLVLLLSLPAAALIIHSGQHHRDESINQGVEEARRLAYSIASEQNNLVAAAHQLVTVLARLPQVRGHAESAVNAILADVHRLNPQYGNIVITDRKGDVWASALPMTVAFSLSDKRTFRKAFQTKQFSSGEYIVGQISSKRTIGFGYPIINDKGEVDGVIAVNINFDHFNELLKQSGLPPGSTFNIIDHNGVIIDRNLEPGRFIGKKASEEILLKIVNGPYEETYIDTVSDQNKIVSYRKLRLEGEQFPYLCIHVSVPLKATLKNARHEQFYNMAILSPLLFIALLLAAFIGNVCFTNRIRKMQEAAKSFAEGNANIRISDYVEGGELGDLSHSLDEMARQLAEREQALRKSEQDYRVLADNSADIIWRLGEDYRISYINPADEKLRGFTNDDVLGHRLTEIMTPEGAARLLELGSERLAREKEGMLTGTIRYESLLLCRDGGTKWAEIQSTPIRGQRGEIVGYQGVARDISDRKIAEEEREKLILELQDALARIRTLSGMLPICASCKKIRDDKGYWSQVEDYISEHSDVLFSHSICPDCAKIAYSELEMLNELKSRG